jgi:hypothetical protein
MPCMAQHAPNVFAAEAIIIRIIGGVMRKPIPVVLIVVSLFFLVSCSGTPKSSERLRSMRIGVWLNTGGIYTVWTDDHYFVVSASGDSVSTNIYCGASQVRFTDKGIARKQNLRLRQIGLNEPTIFTDFKAFRESAEARIEEVPLQIDPGLFDPATCVIKGGIIYDAISEETAEYILLSTCNGDREKIFNDGRAVYLPASGGEYWSYRIETLE